MYCMYFQNALSVMQTNAWESNDNDSLKSKIAVFQRIGLEYEIAFKNVLLFFIHLVNKQ